MNIVLAVMVVMGLTCVVGAPISYVMNKEAKTQPSSYDKYRQAVINSAPKELKWD